MIIPLKKGQENNTSVEKEKCEKLQNVLGIYYCSGEEESYHSGGCDDRTFLSMARAIQVHPDTVPVMYYA